MSCRLVGIIMLALVPAVAAQSGSHHTVSLLGGFGFENGDREHSIGLHFGGRVEPFTKSWLAIRLDLAYSIFPQFGAYTVYAPAECLPPCASTSHDQIALLGANAHMAFLKHSGFAWTVGTGVYHLFTKPHDASYTRLGWTLGLTTSMERSLFFDMRYQGLLGPRKPTRGFTTFLLGIPL